MSDLQSGGAVVKGVVTFLDVLGWKGVYHRQSQPIAKLSALIRGAREVAERASRGRINHSVEIRAISDTIAMFCPCDADEIVEAIEVHGEVCKWLIPQSISAELPLRGATSYGEFELGEDSFVGMAIDEAASWHEHSDWIGVHLTPSAEFVLVASSRHSVWQKYAAPTKTRLFWTPYCVNWTEDWVDRGAVIKMIKDAFVHLGPIVPEIAGKYLNTLNFINAMKTGDGSQRTQSLQGDSHPVNADPMVDLSSDQGEQEIDG